LGRLSNKLWKKSEKLPKNYRLSLNTHLHPLWPPQNELWVGCSGSGPGTHEPAEFQFCETQTSLQKHQPLRGHLNIQPCKNSIQLYHCVNLCDCFLGVDTKEAIAKVYDKLLEQHEEPFKSITKLVTDVSLSIIEGSLEDFRDIIKVLPQK
jgi:hypothetical protein